jgi:predicted double-glycine peptidase
VAVIAKHKKSARAFAALLAASASLALPAFAADYQQVASGGPNTRLHVESMAERKFSTVVRQQYDFSCGSAAIATLLTHHYDRPTTETDAFKAMWEVGDQERIKQLGFSLLEMKRYLESINLKADGFRLTLDRMQEIGVPGIALIEIKGYRHFVVIKGVTPKTVLIGDPSSGVVSRSRKEFEKHWDGTILFVRSEVSRGRANFNKVADWALVPSAPYDRAHDVESLQSLSISQTRPSFSGLNIGVITGSNQ